MPLLTNERRPRRPRPWRLPDLLGGASNEDDRDEQDEALSAAEVQAEIDAAVHLAREQARERALAEARREFDVRIARAEERVRREMEGEVARANQVATDAAKALQSVAQEWSKASSEWLDRIEDNVLALSIAVSKYVLQAELSTSPGKVHGVVQAALKKASAWDEAIRVRLHPDDIAVLESLEDEEFQALVASFKDVDWVSDDSLQRGECLVEGASKLIDGRIDVALQSLYEQVGGDD